MTLLRLSLAMVVVAGFVVAVRHAFDHWRNETAQSDITLADFHFGWLVVAAGCYAVGLMPAILVLRRALRSLGVRTSLRSVASAQLVGHLGKYVPGKAMVVVLRAAVLNRGGGNVSLRAATIAVTIETLTLIAAGAAMSLAVLVFMDTPSWMKHASLVMAVVAGVATLPIVMKRIVSRRIVGGSLSCNWTPRDAVAAWGWSAVGWLWLGASMTAIVLAMPERLRVDDGLSAWLFYATCFASISLAFVSGFISFLPGGAGVRELVLVAMLTPIVGPSGALIAAIVARLLHLGVEAVLVFIAWKLGPPSLAPRVFRGRLAGRTAETSH